MGGKMHKVTAKLFLAAGVCFAPAAAKAFSARDVFGDWVYPENGSVVRIYACGRAICAKIVSVRDRSRRDIHNPDPRLRRRPLAGVVIARNATRIGKTSWRGNLYNTLDGYTYRGTISVIGRNTVTVVGCFAGWAFCEAKTLRRVKETRAGASAVPPLPSRRGWGARVRRR
jgi:uncharacterized protein (DUF2147 family)